MSASSRFFPLLLVSFAFLGSPATAHAQIDATKPYAALFLVRGVEALGDRDQAAASPLLTAPTEMPVALAAVPLAPAPQPSPRGLLPSLYAGLGTLQALDAHSTFRALDAGNVEGNPLMRWSTSHPLAFVSMKAAATAGTILVAQKIRKHHPKRAVAFIAAVNAAYAFVVMHNYRLPGRRP